MKRMLHSIPVSSLLLASILLGSSAPAHAQAARSSVGTASASGTVFARYGRPLRSVTLDLATGTMVRGPLVSDRAATTVVDFFNNDLSGFVGLDTGNGFCEWIDAGVKGAAGNTSDLMNSIVFAYCSAKLSANSGGPGGSVRLGFFEGYTPGGGTPSTVVAVLSLTGLPANTASSSFFGGFRCFFIRVVFASLVCFRDGAIGYSWRFMDSGTNVVNPLGSVLAGTWPFLACVSSCSGSTGGAGMLNQIDQYCPPGTLRSIFTFGTTSGAYTSVSMAIEEVSDQLSTVMALNSGTFPNPDVLTADAATVGQPWTASLTLGLPRTTGSNWVLFFGSSKVAPPNGIPVPVLSGGLNFGSGKAGKMILCALNTGGLSLTTAHSGVSGSVSTTAAQPIPKALGLVCNEWCAQAIVLGVVSGNGNARLSSMVMGTIGSKAP